jgi:hypothetical protein
MSNPNIAAAAVATVAVTIRKRGFRSRDMRTSRLWLSGAAAARNNPHRRCDRTGSSFIKADPLSCPGRDSRRRPESLFIVGARQVEVNPPICPICPQVRRYSTEAARRFEIAVRSVRRQPANGPPRKSSLGESNPRGASKRRPRAAALHFRGGLPADCQASNNPRPFFEKRCKLPGLRAGLDRRRAAFTRLIATGRHPRRDWRCHASTHDC